MSTLRPFFTTSSKPVVVLNSAFTWSLPWAISSPAWRAVWISASLFRLPSSFIRSRRSMLTVFFRSSRVTVNSILGVPSTLPVRVEVLLAVLFTEVALAVRPSFWRPSLPESPLTVMVWRLSPSLTSLMVPPLTLALTPVSLKASVSFSWMSRSRSAAV